MRWRADGRKLDGLARLIRKYKRTHDNDVYKLILAMEDEVLIGMDEFSISGGALKDIVLSMFYFGQPSNARIREVLALCGIEVVDEQGEGDEAP